MMRVYCDFDGTVAGKDVGRELFSNFVGTRANEIAQQYARDQITARECLLAEASLVSGVTAEQLGEFVDQFGIDEHFAAFRDFCTAEGIPLTILSDGLDFYVRRVLDNNSLGDCAFFANNVDFATIGGTTKLDITFPYTDAECLLCGNCKRNHILTLSSDDDVIVYVGDGISDRCPIRYADIVFAKKGLIKYCQEQNISYYEYEDFRDVQRRLEQVKAKKRIKKRREAVMARRDVYMQG